MALGLGDVERVSGRGFEGFAARVGFGFVSDVVDLGFELGREV